MKKPNPLVVLTLAPLFFWQLASADDASGAQLQSGPSGLPRVVITGTQQQDNYRVEKVDSIGPLGTTPILDSPYSIGILPEDLIENSQAVNFKGVSKYLPLVAYQGQQGPDILRPQTR